MRHALMVPALLGVRDNRARRLRDIDARQGDGDDCKPVGHRAGRCGMTATVAESITSACDLEREMELRPIVDRGNAVEADSRYG